MTATRTADRAVDQIPAPDGAADASRPTGRLVMLAPAPGVRSPGMGGFVAPPGFDAVDPYDLDELDLSEVQGIIVSGMCDQVRLSRDLDRFTAWVRDGGRMLVNGHVVRPWVAGMPTWRRLEYRGPADLGITSLAAHPIWAGVDPADLLYRTGVPGTHTHEELERIGVAGFYGRGYQAPLPDGAVVVNGIGPLRAPIDVEFPLGAGRVVVHAGLDLGVFAQTPGTTLTAIPGNIRRWLEAAA